MQKSPGEKQLWYHDGLQFECTGCGRCCTGDPGYVWVNQDEINAIAAAIGMDVAVFEDVFVYSVGRRRSLRELPGGDCGFFDREHLGCRVYAVRPRQCRTWPFWSSNIRTPQTWEKTCESCPGAGQGRVVPLEEIEAQRGTIQI
jgi:uncharacterized protein